MRELDPVVKKALRKQIERDERTVDKIMALLKRLNISHQVPKPVETARDIIEERMDLSSYPLSEKTRDKLYARDIKTLERAAELMTRIPHQAYPFDELSSILGLIRSEKKRLGFVDSNEASERSSQPRG